MFRRKHTHAPTPTTTLTVPYTTSAPVVMHALPTETVAAEHLANFRRVILGLGGAIVCSAPAPRGCYFVTAVVPVSVIDGTHPVFA